MDVLHTTIYSYIMRRMLHRTNKNYNSCSRYLYSVVRSKAPMCLRVVLNADVGVIEANIVDGDADGSARVWSRTSPLKLSLGSIFIERHSTRLRAADANRSKHRAIAQLCFGAFIHAGIF